MSILPGIHATYPCKTFVTAFMTGLAKRTSSHHEKSDQTNGQGQKILVDNISSSEEKCELIDLSIEGNHNFYVSRSHILVHNFAFVIPIATWTIGEGLAIAGGTTLIASILAATAKHNGGREMIDNAKPVPPSTEANKDGNSNSHSVKLPPKTIVKEEGIEIKHYTKSGDHGPAHLHVTGGGQEVRIGQNGKPLKGDPKLTAAQKEIVQKNIKQIRDAVAKMQKWHAQQGK